MRLYKVLSIFLAIFMLVSVLSACAKNGSDDLPKNNEKENEPVNQDENDGGELVITNTFYPKYPKTNEYDGMKAKLRLWLSEKLESGEIFSAKIDGADISEFRARMKTDVKNETDGDGNEHFTATYTDEASNLCFSLTAVLYGDNPTLDMVMNVKNISPSDISGRVSELYVINAAFPLESKQGYEIHTNRGSAEDPDDFLPIAETLTKGNKPMRFASAGGSSSNGGAFPFFDVIGKGEGIIMAVGWSGNWEAGFMNAKIGEVTLLARQQNFDAVLLPNETIRTPSIVLTYFTGDYDYGHNVWRRNVLSHYTPQVNGDDRFIAPISISVWGGARDDDMMEYADNFKDSNADIFWVDAGWYSDQPAPEPYHNVLSGGTGDKTWHYHLGAWAENKNLFPHGIKEVFNYVHNNTKMKTLLWWMIEDARSVVKDNWYFGEENYYMMHDKDGELSYAQVLRLDRDETADMLIDYFRDYMDNRGMDAVRLDKSVQPDGTWRYYDGVRSAEEGGARNGITEAKYIANFYRVWDTLYEEYPDRFFLDNCSSGGRRIDIEMTKRSMPLWRTDENSDLEAQQAMTQYLSAWVPLTASGQGNSESNYSYRSYYSAGTVFGMSTTNAHDIEIRKAHIDEYVDLRPYWYGDYYQLLEPTRDTVSWQAYELYREDWQKGMLVVIRRGSSPLDMQRIKLKGLMPDRTYRLHDIDAKDDSADIVKTGKELTEKGISLSIRTLLIKCYKIELVLE